MSRRFWLIVALLSLAAEGGLGMWVAARWNGRGATATAMVPLKTVVADVPAPAEPPVTETVEAPVADVPEVQPVAAPAEPVEPKPVVVTRSSARQEVVLRYENAKAKKVFVVGDFSEWYRRPMRKQKDGLWAVTLELKPGRYAYQFIADEAKVLDPANPRKNANGKSELVVEP